MVVAHGCVSWPDIDVLYISVLMAESEHLLDSPSLGNRIKLRCMCPLNPNQFHYKPEVSRFRSGPIEERVRARGRELVRERVGVENKPIAIHNIGAGDHWQGPRRGMRNNTV